MATRKLPKGATTRRPSSRGYASNAAKIASLVSPEKVPSNNPSTMSGRRDIQRQAFSENKTGVSKNYKVVDGKMVEIDEAEWKKAAQKFVKQEGTGRGTIKKGQTVANAPKPSKADVIKGAVAKVQGKRGLGGDLSAAERKMAREGNAPARVPATPPTPKPVAPAVTEAPKAPATSAASKMTRAERSAANKAAHAVTRAAEEKKWAEQKAAKKGEAPKAATKPKATVSKPAAPAKAAPVSAAKKTTTAKPTTAPKKTVAKPTVTKTATKPAGTSKPKINPERAERMAVKPVPREGMAKPATPLPMAERPPSKPEAAGKAVRKTANTGVSKVTSAVSSVKAKASAVKSGVSTVIREGLASKAGLDVLKGFGKNSLSLGRGLVAGTLSAGGIAFTGLTYSKDAGNKEADDAVAARFEAAIRKSRREAAAKVPATGTANKPTTPVVKQVVDKKPVDKKVVSQAPKKQTAPKTTAPVASKAPAVAPMTANPEKAIADFEAKLRSAGVVSIAGGAGGKAQMVQQPMSVTQLEDQFKRKKGPR